MLYCWEKPPTWQSTRGIHIQLVYYTILYTYRCYMSNKVDILFSCRRSAYAPFYGESWYIIHAPSSNIGSTFRVQSLVAPQHHYDEVWRRMPWIGALRYGSGRKYTTYDSTQSVSMHTTIYSGATKLCSVLGWSDLLLRRVERSFNFLSAISCVVPER